MNQNQIPKSWYAVAFSSDIPPESVKAIELGNESLVLFRTNSNEICVFDAYCPHLGAHLGVGGKVYGNKIRCPFHGIFYDNKGNCLHKNYSISPLNAWAVVERNGVIFVYYGEKNPPWILPNDHFLESNWTLPHRFIWKDLTIYPKNLLNSGLDANHFVQIHHRLETTFIGKITLQGQQIKGTISGKSKGGLLPGQNNWVNYEIKFMMNGLGYCFTEAFIPTMNLKSRMMFLPSPVSTNTINIYAQITMYKKIKNSIFYKFIPKSFLFKWMEKKIITDVFQFLENNIPTWRYRTPISHPIWVKKEKEISQFREWANQFY